MDFINIFLDVVKNRYMKFDGRARRKEYWNFMLAVVLINIAFTILTIVFGFIAETLASIVSIISMLVSLGLLLPNIAVTVRRLHDTDKEWYFIFIVLIPLVGIFVLLYWLAQAGTVGPNKFGPDPKDLTNSSDFGNKII